MRAGTLTGMRKFGLVLALLLGVLAWHVPAVSHAGALEVARPQAISGRVTVNKGTRVGAETQFKQGDVIDVSGGARFTLAFADGCELDIVGPARLEMAQFGEGGRKIKLVQGVISEAYVTGIALGITTDYGVELVLQNSTATARVVPGDRVTFQRRDGAYLKVYEGDKSQDLKTTWTLSVRAPGGDPVATKTTAGSGDAVEFKLGTRVITYTPASQFTKEDGSGGGVKLIYNGDDYGRVDIGLGTVLFLATGQSVSFDGSGRVTRFDGIAHLYHPINEWSWYEEPIENAADASIADPRER